MPTYTIPTYRLSRYLALPLCILLTACVYVPRTRIAHDYECQGVQKSMVIEPQKMEALQSCNQANCIGVLVSAGVISAASVVVSGSIAVVGNVVYWVERESKCLRQQPQGAQP